MEDQSFPPPDSDHEGLSHFHINTRTGQPFEELLESGLLGKFPMEIAAGIMAKEMMKQGLATSEGAALKSAKQLFNRATKRFNVIKEKNGDDFHILTTPFREDGSLHPDYKTNHYGGHENKDVPTSEKKSETRDGKLINNHPRNETHAKLGQHLESAALHAAKEIQDEAEDIGLKTTIARNKTALNHSKSPTV